MSVSVNTAPGPSDVTDFRFRGLRKIQLGGGSSLDGSHGGLIAVAGKLGVVLVGGDRCLNIIRTEDVEHQDKVSTKQERTQENSSFDKKVVLPLPGPLAHVGVSCDGLTVSVVVRLGKFLSCVLYDTRGLLCSPPDKPLSVTELNTTSASVKMSGLVWNPAIPDMFCISWEDGSLALYTVTAAGQTDCLTLPPATGVRGVDWSPRGKQLVVIKENCELVQYKPDLSVPKYPKLQEMKKVAGPEKAGGCGVSVCWLSTHEFLVGVRQTEEESLSCWLVTGSKAGPVTHTDFDDPCYSTGGAGGRYQCYNISEWGVVAVASSTSIELGVLGLNSPPPGYTQWILEDNARAEIPLHKNEECFPVGLAMDLTAAEPTPAGESVGPPSPLLYLLSSSGLLCPYYCVNTRPGAGPLTCPRENPPAGQRPGTASLPASQAAEPPPAAPVNPPPVPATAPVPTPALAKPFLSSPATSTPVQDKANHLQFSFSTESKPPAQASDGQSQGVGQGVSKTLFGSEQSSAFPLSKSSSSSSQDSNPVSEVTNAKINAAIDEEYEAFEAELEKLRKNMASLKCEVGSEEDKVRICSGVEQCSRFCRDIIETTDCQNTEIFSLRATTLETFSWLEEAVARERSGVEHKYQQLLRARPLDPRSQKMMDNLRSQLFYCEQQVEEVGTVLDTQWDEHVTRIKNNLKGQRVSVLEELSAAVVNNHKILERQEDKVEELELEVRKLQSRYPLTMRGAGKSPEKSRAENELDNLAASLREKSKLSPSAKSSNLSTTKKTVTTPRNTSKLNKTVKSPVGALSPDLDRSIREALDNRPLTVIKPQPRESPSKPSSASLLEKLKSSDVPIITPQKTKPKKVLYEPISPASSSPTQPLGSTTATEPTVGKAIPFNQPAVSTVSSSKVGLGFSFDSPAGAPPPGSSLTSGTGFSLTASTAASSAGISALSSVVSSASTAPKTGISFGLATTTSSLGITPPSTFKPSLPTSTVKTTSAGSASAVLGSSTSAGAPPPFFGVNQQKVSKEGSAPPESKPSVITSSIFGIGGANKVVSSSTTGTVTSSSTVVPNTATPAATNSGPASGFASSIFSSSSSNSSVFGLGSSNKTVSSKVVPSLSSSAPSPFGATSVPNKSIFSSTTAASASVFGASSATPQTSSGASGSQSTSTKSVFGSLTATSTTSSCTSKSVIVTQPPAAASVVTTTSTSQPSSSKSVVGTEATSSSTQSVFGSKTVTSSSVFGSSTASTSSSSTGIFGSQPTSSKSVFGTPATTSSTSSGIFGSQPTSSKSVFGTPTATSTTSSGIFGSQPTSNKSVFGTSTATTSSSSSGIFGSQSTSSQSVFGTPTATTSSSSSGIFGSQPTSSKSVFGSSTATTSSSSTGIFGSQSTSSQSVFGTPTTTTSSSSSTGVFGSQSTSSKSMFGSSTAPTSSASSGIFGSQSTSSKSVFGTPTATPSLSSTGVFGSQSSSSQSVFGSNTTVTTAATSSTTAGVFGSQSSSSSIFGAGTSTSSGPNKSVFGSSAGSTFGSSGGSSVFGSGGSASVFGSQPATSSQPGGGVFGQQTTNSSQGLFGQTSQGGGGFMGGLGGAAKSDNQNKNPFGASTGSSGSQVSSIFGQTSSTPFGSGSQPTGSSFSGSGGGFSSGGNVASSGFAVQQNTPTKPSTFGGAPTFGGQPFGSPPAFGNTLMTSSSASSAGAFGQFGSAASAPTFGSMATGSTPANAPTFGSMATGSTPSFGSGGFGGGASPPPAAPQFSSWR